MNCPMCKRPLGSKIEEHHLIPKTFKGTVTEQIHKICHQKIHSTFSERELKNKYNTWEEINSHEEIQKFVKWLQNKPSDFYIKSKDTNERKNIRNKI